MATKAEILDKLNPQQRDAVINYHGKVALEAIPGSGKTTALVSRIQYMIKDGVKPSKILAFTFTKKAAMELQQRVRAAIGVDADKISISTYHSFCGKLLRLFPEYTGRTAHYSIYDENDKQDVLTKIKNKYDSGLKYSSVRDRISYYKMSGLSVEEAYKKYGHIEGLEQVYLKIYNDYSETLRKNNAFDFDDLPFYAYRISKNNPEVQEYVTTRYDYILADENQDSNKQNLDFILLLGSRSGNIFVVGDTDQSIYGFRGADVDNVIRTYRSNGFDIKFLSTNYRSSANIVRAANYVISHNHSRITKESQTINNPGPRIRLGAYHKAVNEAQDIMEEILRLHNEEGKDWKDIAILCRTQFQTRIFESNFLRAHIPFEIRGMLPFYSRTEVKDILAYLKLAFNSYDSSAFMRVVNVPKRGIGTTSLNKILLSFNSIDDIIGSKKTMEDYSLSSKAQAGLTEFVGIIEHLKNMIMESAPVVDLIRYIRSATNYNDYLENTVSVIGLATEKIENLNELERISRTFTSLEDFLTNAVLDNPQTDTPLDNKDAVNIMTMHASKGLEFDTVFIPGVSNGLVPHSKSLNNPSELEEERRLFYVAMTRAKQNLYITYSIITVDANGIPHKTWMSPFIKEIPRKYLTIIDTSMFNKKAM